MNTQTDSKSVARPAILALEYRPKTSPRIASESGQRRLQGPTLSAYAEPSAEIAYGCVEWFCYDKHPLKDPSGSAKKR